MTTSKKLATAVSIAVAAFALAAAAASATPGGHAATASTPTTACPQLAAVLCVPDDGDPPGMNGEQSIIFGPLAAKSFGDQDFKVKASASSGLPVTFVASGKCTIQGATAHITGVGDCTITASQRGDASHKPANDVVQTFSIAKGATATAMPASGTWGASLYLPYWVRGKGNVAASITVQRNGSIFAHVSDGFSNVTSGHVYTVAWKAPSAKNGAFSFCVTLNYHAHVKSASSCARIHLK